MWSKEKTHNVCENCGELLDALGYCLTCNPPEDYGPDVMDWDEYAADKFSEVLGG